MRTFESLTEREILALAISLEEEDERIYADFAEGLRQDFPASAALFEGMRAEEATHRHRLFELYRSKFGEHIPLIRRQDVKGFVNRRPIWLVRPLRLEKIRNEASTMEAETRRYYERSAARTQDASRCANSPPSTASPTVTRIRKFSIELTRSCCSMRA